ncbi:hypothetical protein M569_15222, partial [Genlisea aurea]
MENNVLWIIGIGVFCWTTLFLLLRKAFPKLSFELCNRLVASSHAIVAVSLASASVKNWSCPVCPLASKSSPQQMQTLAVSLSYLMYDSVCNLFEKQSKPDMAIHHLVSIVGIVSGLVNQRCGSEMVAGLWITELSSPFLHIRDILKEFGIKDTALNLAADIVFAMIFTFARMIGGPYLTYVTLSAPNPLLIKGMALGLQLVSAFWFYKILRMVSHKLNKLSS